jgi:hypothetical protein
MTPRCEAGLILVLFYDPQVFDWTHKCVLFNPFPADVANKGHLGSAPKSHFYDLTGETEVIGLSDLMTLFY